MTNAKDIAEIMTASRFGRLPLVLLLTVGLLFSLLHCANCDVSLAQADTSSIVAMTINHDSTPDNPEQQSLCHSGHCLSHATVQPAADVSLPADLVAAAPSFGGMQFHMSRAGLSLFKPPRA